MFWILATHSGHLRELASSDEHDYEGCANELHQQAEEVNGGSFSTLILQSMFFLFSLLHSNIILVREINFFFHIWFSYVASFSIIVFVLCECRPRWRFGQCCEWMFCWSWIFALKIPNVLRSFVFKTLLLVVRGNWETDEDIQPILVVARCTQWRERCG